MFAAFSAAVTCAFALLLVESRELRLGAIVALAWFAAAPLVRAPSAARAALVVSAAALPFHGVALVADVNAGAPALESFAVAALALAWCALLGAGAVRAARAERAASKLGLWLCAAWLGPVLSVASHSAGQHWELAAWLNVLSPPWWLLEHARIGPVEPWWRALPGAAAPSALTLAGFALSARGEPLRGAAHGA